MKPDAKKLLIQLVINLIIIVPLYFVIATYVQFPYIHYIYLAAGAGLAFYYVIYNRGFVGKNATPESLPDSMSAAEKQEFLEDCRRRRRDSRWVLTLLIPIILTFLADAAILYLMPSLEAVLT